jgi:DNA-binding transcriptional LysR family regulator
MVRNELKLMESAIALAEELNFTRAARKLRISQPARDKRNVRLTDAGRAYVEEARIVVFHASRAHHAARAAQQDAEMILNVGKSPYIDPFLTTTLLSLHLPLFPRLQIELRSQFSFDLAHDLLAGDLDLAIATEPPETPLLTTLQVSEGPFYIAMSRRDGLATQPSVDLEALTGRPWVLFERRLHPLVYDTVMQVAEEHRVVPAKIRHVTMPEEAYQFIADGSSVAFLVKAGALLMARNGITVRPLTEPALSLKTFLVSRADNDSKPLSELVRAFMRKILDVGKSEQMSLPISA